MIDRTRVFIVDDSEVTAAGMATLLAGDPAIEVVAVTDHGGALAWDGEWSSVDVVVVDAADPVEVDTFPGVQVIEHVRPRARPDTTIVVLTDRFAHAGLRRRLRDARVDALVSRDEVRSRADLVGLLLAPSAQRDLAVVEPPAHLGLTSMTDINGVVAYMRDHGLAELWRDVSRPRSRSDARHRAELGRIGHLRVVDVHGHSMRLARHPSIPQLLRIWDWSTRLGPRD